jgi:hypothetical protein
MHVSECVHSLENHGLESVRSYPDSSDGTEHRIQGHAFFVHATFLSNAIRINNLTVHNEYVGKNVASTVVRILQEFADECGVVLLATNVLPEEQGFWSSSKVGFVPDPTNPDDFLPPEHIPRMRRVAIPR